MKSILSIGLLTLTVSFAAMAQQDFKFDYIESRLDDSEINEADVRSHYLGDVIARKMVLLNDSYVFFEEASPTNPLPTRQVDKYPIYSTVKKLNAYYKKSIKKGKYSKEDAFSRYNKVLDVAICIRYQNTTDFEATLLTVKDPVSLDELFAEKVLLSGLYDEAITRVE